MPKSPFPGFPAEAQAFLAGLEKNNRREWFQPRKEVFEEQVRGPVFALVEALNASLLRFAPEYCSTPAKAVFRIYRDTRFSKDKTPYKTQIAAVFYREGLGKEGGGLYFSVSHKKVEIGGGIWMPDAAKLQLLRPYLAEHHAALRTLAKAKKLRMLFGEMEPESYARVPKGFPSDHAAADLLRLKHFLFFKELGPELVTSPALFEQIRSRFEALTPFVEFLNLPLRPRRAGDARPARAEETDSANQRATTRSAPCATEARTLPRGCRPSSHRKPRV